MPVNNRIAAFADDMTAWRRDFHENPELLYEVHRTAAIVAEKLKAFGCDEVVPGIGRTGVVAVIKGNKPGSKVVGVRADMDALPMEELTGKPYASKIKGKMHACGHDGHTAMLLGAARYLAETRNFAGTAIMIFQPAEEGGAGAKAMIDDGLLERWNIQEVYGLHNMPAIPVGNFAIRPGPAMAAADRFTLTIEGKGGHGAMPHMSIDTVLVGTQVVNALQSIVSRNMDPLDSAVVSVTSFKSGDAFNVIPQHAVLLGTVRTFKPETRDMVEKQFRQIVSNTVAAFGATAKLDYERGYPVTANDPAKTDFVVDVAREIAGHDRVNPDTPPLMGAEDFSYMLEQRPGAYIFLGNGDTAACHHPAYDFDDTAAPYGASFLARVVERAMPV